MRRKHIRSPWEGTHRNSSLHAGGKRREIVGHEDNSSFSEEGGEDGQDVAWREKSDEWEYVDVIQHPVIVLSPPTVSVKEGGTQGKGRKEGEGKPP